MAKNFNWVAYTLTNGKAVVQFRGTMSACEDLAMATRALRSR